MKEFQSWYVNFGRVTVLEKQSWNVKFGRATVLGNIFTRRNLCNNCIYSYHVFLLLYLGKSSPC